MKKKIFLLAGQSNMQGCGNFGTLPVYKDRRIFNFKDGKWHVAEEPLHNYTCKIWPDGGAGLAMSFGLRLLEEFPEWEIGFVPCAVSSSALELWQPGAELFENAVSKTSQALKQGEGELVTILWHQGEFDSRSRETAETYSNRFNLMINGFRKEFNNEDLPIIAGGLNNFLARRPEFAYYQIVNNALKRTATAFVSSKGLTANDRNDNTHFDTKSLREFGVRYAEAYLNLQKKQGLC